MITRIKTIIKLLLPPIVVKFYVRIRSSGRAKNEVKVVGMGNKPAKQDLELYFSEEYANVLEDWGIDTVWIEVDLLFSTLKGKVLDMACGTGPTIKILNRNKNLEVYGFDISEVLIERAKKKGILAERLKVADGTLKSYQQNEFDHSFSIGSIEHFTEVGINFFLRYAAFYTKEYSVHMLPVNKDGINKGWEKTEQSYFNNSTEWWLAIFRKYFSEIHVIDSTWSGLDQQGKWFVCKK